MKKEAFAGFSSHFITTKAKIGWDGTAQLIHEGKKVNVETLMNKADYSFPSRT